MHRVWNRDLAVAVLTLALAGIYLREAARIPRSALSDNVGAGGFPTVIGWALVIASVALAARALLTPDRSDEHRAAEPESAAAADAGEVWADPARALRRCLGLAAIAATFLLLLPRAGYIVSTAFLLFSVAAYMGRPAGLQVVAVAVGGAICLFCIFVLLLDIPLPVGTLWRGRL